MVLYPTADELRQREQQASQVPLSSATASHSYNSQRMSDQSATPYLDHNQQDLLLAALNSQVRDRQQASPQPGGRNGDNSQRSKSEQETGTMAENDALFMSPQNAQLDIFEGDYTPELDYLDGEDGFDFDNADLGGDMIGALPGDAEQHEKRKSPDDKDADDNDPKRQETQDGEKGAKKPGRKPLTSEPTTKRKAQNRAAQRAFRERKEKHLKDLETKVTELTKTKEADKHENGLLKAQIERLQIELREYRKRLSLNAGSGSARQSPPLNAYTGQSNGQRSNSGNYGPNQFQFDFPKFGALPGSQIFGNGNITPPATTASPTTTDGMSRNVPQVQRQESQKSTGGRSASPRTATPSNTNSAANTPPQQRANSSYSSNFPSVGYSTSGNMHGFASTLPQMNADNPFGDLFSPGLLKSANFENGNSAYFGPNSTTAPSQSLNQTNLNQVDLTNGGETGAGLNRVFQFNGGNSSASDSASPSGSSNWNANANSSCGTSPEPSHDSPANKPHSGSIDSYTNDKSNPLRQSSNASDFNGHGSQQQNGNNGMNAAFGNPNIGFTGNQLDTLGNLNVPTSQSFDPVLFGDYRDPTLGDFNASNDFSTAFFDDALNNGPFDYGSPSTLFGILQSPTQQQSSLNVNQQAISAPTPSCNLMKEIEKARDGGDDDYGLPVQQAKQQAAHVPENKDQKGKLISCNNIWNQLQSNPDFQSGTFDLDNLCSELRSKARCSESGVMVSQDHVDAALKKLGKKDDKGKFQQPKASELPPLMFEQQSWDNILKKLEKNTSRRQ